jgi:hypothetical protein
VHRTLSVPPYLEALFLSPDGSPEVLVGTMNGRALWRVDANVTRIADLELRGLWEFALAGGDAVVATSGDHDPRMIVPGKFAVALAEGATGRGAASALPDGGWLVALGPRAGAKQLLVLRVAPDGQIAWRSASDELGDVIVDAVEPEGAVDVEVGTQPRRLLVNTETGALELPPTALGPRWTAGSVHDVNNTVEGVQIPLETWREDKGAICVGGNPCAGDVVAGAVYVIKPAGVPPTMTPPTRLAP